MPLESHHPRYWRSLDELADTPAFRQFATAEFPAAWDRFVAGRGAVSRRELLKLAGASLALAGLTACRWPKENIVPATRQPANRIPGVPVQYATACDLAGVATGLLVTSLDGRPIKIEGNEKHPFSNGKTSALLQAGLLDLYDPDRSQQPAEHVWLQRGARVEPPQTKYRTWGEFQAFAGSHFAPIRANGGAGLSILTEASSSPSLADMKARLLRAMPQVEWLEFEPLSRDHEREGAKLAFAKPYRTHLHLDQADVIVSLDCDLLMTHPAAVKYAADFAARRRADDGTMNRLYVVESNLTITGSMADHRYPVRSSQVLLVACHLVAALLKHGVRLPPPAQAMQSRLADLAHPAQKPPFVEALAKDLARAPGRAVVIAGPRQSPSVHALVHLMNEMLGNVGRTVTYTAEPDPDRLPHAAALAALTETVHAGRVATLLILGGNPVYGASNAASFDDLLRTVNTSIHLSPYDNETSQRCTWHVPQAHYLEAWGDARAYDGTVSIVQPLIEPLYGGQTALELLALIAGEASTTGYDLVRRTFREQFAGADEPETAWRQALHDGVVPNTNWPQRPVELVLADWPTSLPPLCFEKPSTRFVSSPPDESTFELVLAQDHSTFDGRFANNAWLQEMPDPITKLTWDNAALLSPQDAQKLGVKTYGDVVKISVDGRSIEIPAYILPGHATGSITLPAGYGRSAAAGKVAHGAGVNVFRLFPSAGSFLESGTVATTGQHVDLATTQDHHAIQSQIGDEETQKRVPLLVRETTLEHYKQHPDFAQHAGHHPPLESLWQEKEYKDHKWGMAIDLSACTGCSACVVACQAENNIPVVGKDEVARGREMHWIRIDRYFRAGLEGAGNSGLPSETGAALTPASPESPDPSPPVHVVHQPVACVHCELAPCEQVCPVAATVHDEEGLNVMVYNRCVGTRYCSNNCPFKVRRFNWFYNHHGPAHPRSVRKGVTPLPGLLPHAELTEIEKMGHNPNVTVRSRGVMEKCTYCTQRIAAVKITARNERWTTIPDGLIQPACAQACPTSAIAFGDLNDPHSRVRKLQEHHRAYTMLEELNIKPRTKYLAKLKNPAEKQA